MVSDCALQSQDLAVAFNFASECFRSVEGLATRFCRSDLGSAWIEFRAREAVCGPSGIWRDWLATMSTKRIPIRRPIRSQIPPEAVDLFGEMKTLKCTCPPIDFRKVLGAARMSRMRTLVEPALAISSVVAGDTTLALAGHPRPSRPMPLPGGVVCGSAVEAK